MSVSVRTPNGAKVQHGYNRRELYTSAVWFKRGYVRVSVADCFDTWSWNRHHQIDLTPAQARHVAERLRFFADQAEEGE